MVDGYAFSLEDSEFFGDADLLVINTSESGLRKSRLNTEAEYENKPVFIADEVYPSEM